MTGNYTIDKSSSLLPLKSGFTRHMESGPRLANWPKETSRKKTGSPHSASIRMYGMRKAPAMEEIHQYSVGL